jgi:hypothetical protein
VQAGGGKAVDSLDRATCGDDKPVFVGGPVGEG